MLGTQFQFKGATPFKPFNQGTVGGLLPKINKAMGYPSEESSQTPVYPTPNGQPIKQGTQKGLIDTHTPSTPVKSITDSQGNKVDFHSPPTSDAPNTKDAYNSDGSVKPMAGYTPPPQQPNPATPYPNSPQGTQGNNLNALAGASNLGNNQMYNDQYNQAGKDIQAITAMQQGESQAGVGGVNNLNRTLSGNYNNLFAPQTTGNLQGEKGILDPLLNQASTAAGLRQSQALAEQQLGQTGANQIAGYGQNQQLSPTSMFGNPITGNRIGDVGGAYNQAQFASDVGSVGDLQTKLNAIDPASQNFNTNFATLTSNAQQAKSVLPSNLQGTPITKLVDLFANGTLGSDPRLSAFMNNLNTVKQNYKDATGSDLVIPAAATLDQLGSIEQNAKSAIEANKNALKSKINNIKGNQSSGGTDPLGIL